MFSLNTDDSSQVKVRDAAGEGQRLLAVLLDAIIFIVKTVSPKNFPSKFP